MTVCSACFDLGKTESRWTGFAGILPKMECEVCGAAPILGYVTSNYQHTNPQRDGSGSSTGQVATVSVSGETDGRESLERPREIPPASTPGHNAHAEFNRQKKVEKIVTYLREKGIGAADAKRIKPDWWGPFAKSIGINEPSEVTIAAVIKRLEEFEIVKNELGTGI